MRESRFAVGLLVLGVLGAASLEDAACAANIRNHLEIVRRNAPVVYLGVVGDIELSEQPPGGRLEVRADVHVLFVARSPAGESPSTVTLEVPTWDEEHTPYVGDGQYRLDPGSLVVVFADSWGGGEVRYLLNGEREELLEDLEVRRSRLAEMSAGDLEFHEIDNDDRQIQIQLYRQLAAAGASFGTTSAPGPGSAIQTETVEETPTTMRAKGAFEVKLGPLETYNQAADAKIGRMSIDKTFAGDLVGTSQGEMLSGGSPAEGSAGYVAIERVTGALQGRSGSFLLQHSGTMTPTSQKLTISIVPDSGTGDLQGIAGAMSIEIEDGRHLYDLEYTVPSTPGRVPGSR